MSKEEYIIDNLITETRLIIDHRDDNETFLSKSQDCIEKIKQIEFSLNQNTRNRKKNRSFKNYDLIFEGAVLIWNILLPFLNAQYRIHVYKAFSMAYQLLEQLQCVDHALRVNFHIELAKKRFIKRFSCESRVTHKKGPVIRLQCSIKENIIKFDEGENLGLYQRSSDKYLCNLEEKEPKNDIERVITQLENVQAAKSEIQELIHYRSVQEQLKMVLKKQENLYQFKQKKLLASKIARLAFEWEFNDLAFKALTWDVKNGSEMILAQVACQYRMAQMIKDNFKIPFVDPIRVEELSQEKKRLSIILKKNVFQFWKRIQISRFNQTNLISIYWSYLYFEQFLNNFRNPILQIYSKLLPEITNLLKEFLKL